jgi:hypothetical protein
MRSTATGITWIRRVSLAFCTPLTFSLAGPQDADIRILQKLTLYIGPRRICGVCNSVAQRTRIVSPTPSCLRCRSFKKKKTASQVTTYEQGCPSKNSQLDHSLVRLSRDTKIMSATAQRPNDKTLCDYYALLLYGANSSVTQFYLIQEIVTLAFIGGSSLPNASQSLTGILNPGTFLNTSVDLGGFFNASLLSSNVNNGPAAVNWLDGGGTQPLVDFVSGKTANLTLANTTNE